jgi:D-glycero-D-manno-heptose 1,7-bisphosphate phosphatase
MDIGRQCVVLTGGLGTRLGRLVEQVPKPMLPVGGRPFLEQLVRQVRRFGFDSFLFLAGYRGEVVAEHFQPDGLLARELGARFTTLIEPRPLGTAGALRQAIPLLENAFLMLNGDSFFDFNVLDLATREASGAVARIALREVADVDRYGVAETVGDRIVAFHPVGRRAGLVNAGVYWLTPDILEALSPDDRSLELDVFTRLAARGRLAGVRYEGYFVDIGVPTDYQGAQSGLPNAIHRPAVFFDRDNVLNHDDGYTHRTDGFRWIEGAERAVKLCNDLGYFVFVVSNQAGVARGLYDIASVEALHSWMNGQLRTKGAHIDAFKFCPHHPEGTVAAYRQHCGCRKPRPGMLLELSDTWPLASEGSILIGDQDSDLEAAERAGFRGVKFPGGNLEAFVKGMLPRSSRLKEGRAALSLAAN